MRRHRRYIDYTIYESSKLATLINAIGALCKFKWAEKIADNAIINSNNQRNT